MWTACTTVARRAATTTTTTRAASVSSSSSSSLGRLSSTVRLQSTLVSSRAPVTQLSDDEQMLRDSVRRFADERVAPLVDAMDRAEKMDAGLIDACFEQGLMAAEIPSEWGGAGMSFTAALLVIEELARVDASVSVMVDIHNTLIVGALHKYGNDEQKQRLLERLCTRTLGSFCLSEPESGSDAFALRTTATRNGDEWVLNGTKAWISNSYEAGVFIVLANAAPERGYKGITAFLVDGENPGLELGKREDKLGLRASSTAQVHLSDCVVAARDVLGEVGQGYKIAIGMLNEGRVGIGAQQLGIAKGAYARTLPYLVERRQFGQSISTFQGVQFQLAELATEIHLAELAVYNAARAKEAGTLSMSQAAMAKLVASRTAERVASECINLMGGVGFTREYGVEKRLRDAKAGQIYEGTSNTLLQTIAKVELAGVH